MSVNATTELPPAIAERLRCPRCGAAMTVDGRITCVNHHELPVRGGFLDALVDVRDEATARTLDSFGYEWTSFDTVQPEDEEFWRWYFADVPLDRIRGKVGLDAGCGKGRFSRFTAAHVGALVALDGSDAVTAAVRNLADRPNVVVVRSDLRAAPFAPGSFDFISCLGVLHHLTDPQEGFRRLVDLLAPGGLLLVYLYSRGEGRSVRSVGLSAAAALRRLTVRLPHRLLRLVSGPIALVLYASVVVPGRVGDKVKSRRLQSLPLKTYRGRPLRSLWLDTFDRLSAPLERRYVWAELEPWFAEAGLHVLAAREDAGWFVVAEKPQAAGER